MLFVVDAVVLLAFVVGVVADVVVVAVVGVAVHRLSWL